MTYLACFIMNLILSQGHSSLLLQKDQQITLLSMSQRSKQKFYYCRLLRKVALLQSNTKEYICGISQEVQKLFHAKAKR
jgi:hypothetical protein